MFSVAVGSCASLTPTLAPGEDCTVDASFSPTAVGIKGTTLRIASNDPDTPNRDVALSGTGAVPDIAVNPGSHDFGSVLVGDTSTLEMFTITNSGSGNLLVSSIDLSGDDAAMFDIGSILCVSGDWQLITPGVSCFIRVTFEPSSAGIKSAALDITSNDPDEGTLNIGLSGTGTLPPAPDITVSPGSHDFASILVGSVSAAQTFTISNPGTENLVVSSIGVTGGDAAMFSVAVGSCASLTPTIASGADCTVEVSFSPTAEGIKVTTLRIASNDPDTPNLDVSLSGTGAVPTPDISVSPSSHDFGSVEVGSASATQTFTLSNSGTAKLVISALDLMGIGATEFNVDLTAGNKLCGALPILINAGESCTYGVSFTPQSDGTRNVNLAISSNDPDEGTVNITMSGTGTAAPSHANQAPVLDHPISGQAATVGIAFELIIPANTFSDADGDALSLSATGLPAGLSFSDNGDNSATIGGTPSEAGTFKVELTVTDGKGGTLSGSFEIVVTPAGVDNQLPTIPMLVTPEDGATGLDPTSIEFGWSSSADPDDDPIHYELYICEDASFAGCEPTTVNVSKKLGIAMVGVGGMGGSLWLLGLFGGNNQRRRRNQALMLILLGMMLTACGGGASKPTADVTQILTDLKPGTTYYWKVVVIDDKNGRAESEVRSFTTSQ